ncbi:MAG: carbohydrate kinase family protein [Spirochaetales bacterium]|nr:carbohydrate kinase family protein [Spirochaetales bacterium]
MRERPIVVIGGANLDIIALPEGRVWPGDSAPGTIRFAPGGVGRNIAQALAGVRPDSAVELITALGEDGNSRFVREESEKGGVSLAHSYTFPGRSCPAYAAVMDGGDLLAGVNDMTLLEELTPRRLESGRGILERAEMLIIDANLTEESLVWLGENFSGRPIFAEPVSAAKCPRLRPLLPRLFGLKPNRAEAEVLTGRKIRSAEEALDAAKELNSLGVKHVLITLGREGSVYASPQESGVIEAPPLEGVEDVTGAGDYYLAGAVSSLMEGANLEEAARTGALWARKRLSGEK